MARDVRSLAFVFLSVSYIASQTVSIKREASMDLEGGLTTLYKLLGRMNVYSYLDFLDS